MNFTKIGQTIILILGAIIGLYIGGWLCFIGGIGGMVNAYQTLNVLLGMWSLIKFFIAGPLGWAIFILSIYIASLFD